MKYDNFREEGIDKKIPELIVMLTHNDRTVEDAWDVFQQGKDTAAKFWGMKEEPLPRYEMKELFGYMKKCGKTTVLEVVAYTEKECLEGAKLAAYCGCDILMGTIFSKNISTYCNDKGIKYLPFAGKVSERPSILEGEIEDIIKESISYIERGAFGIDLLGYRYKGDAVALNKAVVENVDAPICIAGSVDSFARLDEIKEISPWAVTIGGAFFEQKFGKDIKSQIDAVCEYMKK